MEAYNNAYSGENGLRKEVLYIVLSGTGKNNISFEVQKESRGMSILPFVVVTTILVLILVRFLRSGLHKESDPYPKMRNDKLVIVQDINYPDLKKMLTDFFRMYNDRKHKQFIPRVTEYKEGEFAITFPQDIDFEIFCYCINYLVYPLQMGVRAKVSAWTTTRKGDPWINPQNAEKKVMLFIPAENKEYDVVFLTTQDHIGFKISFAFGVGEELLEEPVRSYMPPPIDIGRITSNTADEFN